MLLVLLVGVEGMYGMKFLLMGWIGGEFGFMLGMWFFLVGGRGDLVWSKGIWVFLMVISEFDDGCGFYRGELVMDDFCLFVKFMVLLGILMFILFRFNVFIWFMLCCLWVFIICVCFCIFLKV